MANKSSASKNETIHISVGWQRAFLVVFGASWLLTYGAVLYPLLKRNNDEYLVTNVWPYMLLTAVYPLLYILVGLAFTWRDYTRVVQKLFMAGFIGLIGYAAYSTIYFAYQVFLPMITPNMTYKSNLGVTWGFGNTVLVMAICLGLFTAALWYIKSRTNQK